MAYAWKLILSYTVEFNWHFCNHKISKSPIPLFLTPSTIFPSSPLLVIWIEHNLKNTPKWLINTCEFVHCFLKKKKKSWKSKTKIAKRNKHQQTGWKFSPPADHIIVKPCVEWDGDERDGKTRKSKRERERTNQWWDATIIEN